MWSNLAAISIMVRPVRLSCWHCVTDLALPSSQQPLLQVMPVTFRPLLLLLARHKHALACSGHCFRPTRLSCQTYPACVVIIRARLQHGCFLHPSPFTFHHLPELQMGTSMPQFLSAVPIRWLWGHRALILLFKMGVTWPMMAALMHRLPWQDLAVLCGCFCLWLCATWVQPLCTHLQSSPADAAFIQSISASLDRLTGLSASSAAVASGLKAAVGTAGGAGAAAVHAVVGSGLQEEQWMPLANRIAATCIAGASNSTLSGWTDSTSSGGGGVLSGPDCESLLMGQCMAVVTSLTLWVGVLVILFCVLLAEQHSKWRWWHSTGVHWQQGRVPTEYAPSCIWAFLGSRLLYLHVLLDLPLLLLWVGTSTWYRQPIGAFGGYNLW